MIVPNPKERSARHSLSEAEFRFICKLVYDQTGIVLDERKREMLYRRLMRRIREIKLDSFSAYCDLLEANDENELPQFINAITTNLTSFFREIHHFNYLREQYLPKLINDAGNHRRLRIWSAGCSTGEEPYTIAITLMETMGAQLSGWDAKILATDLDSDVVATGSAGIYRADRIEDLSTERQQKWFQCGKGNNAGYIKVNPKLRELITFKQLNLLHEWPMKGPFDIIFCRNVVIYFDKPTQAKLFSRYHGLLKPGGLLILGHSENLNQNAHMFGHIGKTMFLKKG